jgi:5'-3' exonuclease
MGIPAYFSHLIKNHSNIVKNPNTIDIDNLYIDSNSIIYDVIHSLENKLNFEEIYKLICEKLLSYINQLNPKSVVYIAFDGVAPIAKLNQQRTRRYRSIILEKISKQIDADKKDKWDTTQITPGTKFMNDLSNFINDYFSNSKRRIIISTSRDRGEGEHKIFQYIRDNKEKHLKENTVIYGLDADLIMLSMLHSKYCENIYLYRETPHFIKHLNSDLNPNELYMLDIKLLCEQITLDMNNFHEVNHEKINILIEDYVFITFILGNDFIPHSPSINIRTNGIDILLDIYRTNFSWDNSIIQDSKIQWKQLRKLFEILSHSEKGYLINEHMKRDKLEHRYYPTNTIEEKEFKLNSLPVLHRSGENFINPSTSGWRNRYYSTLFNSDNDDKRIQKICLNYLEALEWTYKYYSNGCFDWRWKYNHEYTPLFEDLLKFTPFYDISYIKFSDKKEINPITQLCYVLPIESHYLIPESIRNKINKKQWYSKDVNMIWHYCKYIWESHLDLQEINITELEYMIHT